MNVHMHICHYIACQMLECTYRYACLHQSCIRSSTDIIPCKIDVVLGVADPWLLGIMIDINLAWPSHVTPHRPSSPRRLVRRGRDGASNIITKQPDAGLAVRGRPWPRLFHKKGHRIMRCWVWLVFGCLQQRQRNPRTAMAGRG